MFSPAINGSDDFKMKYSHLELTTCYSTYMVVCVNIKREMVLLPNDEEVANSSKNIPNSRLECTNHTLFQTKMVKIDTLFQTKMAKKKDTLQGGTYLLLYPNNPPPPPCRSQTSNLIQSNRTAVAKNKTQK